LEPSEEVRLATLADASEITRVHIASWRDAYRHILPREHLEGLDERWLLGRREQSLMSAGAATHVAQHGGQLVGYCVAGRNRGPPPTIAGEMHAIYLLPEAQGRGLGRKLTLAAARWVLAELGPSMIVWTFEQNAPARGFYQHLGGSLCGYRFLSIDGAGIFPVVAYGWENLRAFLAAAR
jgi:GNAT superfamily N-acetyltransferase